MSTSPTKRKDFNGIVMMPFTFQEGRSVYIHLASNYECNVALLAVSVLSKDPSIRLASYFPDRLRPLHVYPALIQTTPVS